MAQIKSNKDIMAAARQQLTGKWGACAVFSLVYWALLITTDFIPFVSLITSPLLMFGGYVFYLALVRGQNHDVKQLFEGFRNLRRSFQILGTAYLQFLFVILWSLLLVVPGIIAGFSYSLSFLLILDNDKIEPWEAIQTSKQMMKGYKKKLFYLTCRFSGWFLLCVISVGIASFWVIPYLMTSFCLFYEEVKQQYSGEIPARPN